MASVSLSVPLSAAIIDSGPVSLAVPATFDGLYLNMVNRQTGSAVQPAGWDINFYAASASVGMQLFLPNASHGVVGGSVAAVLASGAVIGPSSTFGLDTVGGDNFRTAGTRFLGLRFINETGGGTHYGYVQIESGAGATPGFPAFIRRFVYESVANTAITIPSAINWVPLGPGPANGGGTEGASNPNAEVVGAIEVLAPHPSSANILYVAAVNGGIWRTDNANASSPDWLPLTDQENSLSMGSLEFDPTDASNQTLLAGTARVSSLAGFGGDQSGLLYTSNGGTSWTPFNPLVFNGLNIVGSFPRGNNWVIATNNGLFTSANRGGSYTRVSSGNGASTGLPDGNFSDLVSFRGDSNRFFAALINASAGGAIGIYRSSGNAGASWIKVSSAAIDAAMLNASKVEMAVRSNTIAVAIVPANGRLSAIFHSEDGGGTWLSVGVPTTNEGAAGAVGIHAGGQGGLHLSIALDPTDPDIIYIGGDRQPLFNEGAVSPLPIFPNSIGARNFSGRLFRGNVNSAPASRWQPLTHSGTASNSAPHADSRDMAFNAAGVLLESDDGGVYQRTSPALSSGDWFSINGDLQSSETHSMSFDVVSKLVISGTQDNGTLDQLSENGLLFRSLLSGDGGDNAIEMLSNSQSIRYASAQNLGNLFRATFDVNGAFNNVVTLALAPVDGSAAVAGQFITPIAVNKFAPSRLLIGAANGVYESRDRGDTVRLLNSNLQIASANGTPIVYGISGNPDFLLVGVNQITPAVNGQIYRRTSAGGPLTLITTLPQQIEDLAVDPANSNRVFAVTLNGVLFSSDGGVTFNSIVGQLGNFTFDHRTVIYIPDVDPALVVGARHGVFISRSSSNFTLWQSLSQGLPRVPVFELDFDKASGALTAGTLGRGTWRLRPFLADAGPLIFSNGFE